MSFRVTALLFAATFTIGSSAADPSIADIQPIPPAVVRSPVGSARAQVVTKSISLQAKSIQWNKDLNTGRSRMVKTDQPMILFVTAPACQYCELMKETTFTQKWIVQQINEKFTPVMINGREEKEVADKLRIRYFPATAIVHPSGKVVEIAHGYKSPNEFLKYLAVARAKLDLEQKALAARNATTPAK